MTTRIRPSDYKPPYGASVADLQALLKRAATDALQDPDRVALFLHSANPRLGMASPSGIATCSGGLTAAIGALTPVKKPTRRASGGML